MFNDIKNLRDQKKSRKKENEKILKQKEKYEKDVRTMQVDTEAMENCQRDLLA